MTLDIKIFKIYQKIDQNLISRKSRVYRGCRRCLIFFDLDIMSISNQNHSILSRVEHDFYPFLIFDLPKIYIYKKIYIR